MTSKVSLVTTKESESHKKTSNTARGRKRQERRVSPVRFVCVDGEGVTDADGNHKYVLLGCGERQIENPRGLSFTEIMEFLYSCFEEGGVAFTGFFLSYDFTQWLRSLPENRVHYLLSPQGKEKRARRVKGAAPFPVEYQGWEFDILGTKRFKLRPVGKSRWMYICDSGPFFQKAFLKVIDPKEWSDPVVTPEEYETIRLGKERRATAVLDNDMRYYNKRENAILADVLGRLDEGFRELGIHLSPKQWFGPGQAAGEWLKAHSAITATELASCVPHAYLDAARKSYFGGWFEIFAHGLVPGVAYEYDINSAYPHIISQLPCLRHGQYTSGNDSQIPSGLSLVYASISSRTYQSYGDHSRVPIVGTMLHRLEDGNVCRPINTEGWYWAHEINSAIRAGLYRKRDVHVREWRRFEPTCDCPPPFREVADIYALRQRVGKKTPLGIACKLVPNSLYGKFAQSVGNPEFGNPVYASYITSRCRGMILGAIATHPAKSQDLLMVATDGIYFRTPHPHLPVSNALGDWDTSEKHNLLLFKPGVYWDDSTRERIRDRQDPEFKTRGVSARDFSSSLGEIERQFALLRAKQTIPYSRDPLAKILYPNGAPWPSVEFLLSFTMVSAIQALARGKWDTAGTLIHDNRVTQSSDPGTKRTNPYWRGDLLRSRPLYLRDPVSVPYEKRFGMADPYSDEWREQFGVSPDGIPSLLMNGMLGHQ